MPSTPTPRLRAELQSLGEGLNVWGHVGLNNALQRLEEGIAGLATIPIAGPSTVLTAANYSADQARNACLVFTGTLTAASTVTVPNVEKLYLAVNLTSGAFSLTLKTAAGAGVALRSGPQWVRCDGADVHLATPRLDQTPLAAGPVDLNAQRLTNLGAPSATTDAATKTYVDAAIAAFTGGTAPQYRTGDGTVSAPSFSFQSDTNTGLRRVAADTVGIVTGGADRLTVDAAGSVTLPTAGADILFKGAAGATSIGYQPAVIHQLANTTTTVNFGIDDGGGPNWSGMTVTNFREGSANSQKIAFSTAQGGISLATEHMVIESTGHIRLGPTIVPGYAPDGQGATLGLALWPMSGRFFASQSSFSQWNQTADGPLLYFARSGTQVGSISVTTTATAYNTSSDYRLKTDVVPLTGAVARVRRLKPSRFRFKADPAEVVDGFLAHEVAAVVPHAVTGEKDGDEMQSVDLSKLVPLLTAALQEAVHRIEALEGRANG